MPSTLPFITAPDKHALGQRLTQDLLPALQEAIAQRGNAVMVVSGGSTPMPFFRALASSGLELRHLTLLMADERWVAPTHLDSNERLLHEAFAGTPVQIVSLAPLPDEPLQAGAARLDALLHHIDLRPDISILGMGDDGHTASLFPHHAGLEEGLHPSSPHYCIAVSDSPKPPPERVTLTYRALMRSRQLVVHITGETKKDIIERAMVIEDIRALPIAAFLQQGAVPCSIYWAE